MFAGASLGHGLLSLWHLRWGNAPSYKLEGGTAPHCPLTFDNTRTLQWNCNVQAVNSNFTSLSCGPLLLLTLCRPSADRQCLLNSKVLALDDSHSSLLSGSQSSKLTLATITQLSLYIMTSCHVSETHTSSHLYTYRVEVFLTTRGSCGTDLPTYTCPASHGETRLWVINRYTY